MKNSSIKLQKSTSDHKFLVFHGFGGKMTEVNKRIASNIISLEGKG